MTPKRFITNRKLIRIVGEIRLFAGKKTKFRVVCLLVVLMFIIPIATLETSIPTASFELVNGVEIDESERVIVNSSAYSPISSVTLINESVMSSDNYWIKIQHPSSNFTRFFRTITVPFLNVSEIILGISAYIVTGPLEISMYIYPWRNSTTGQTGEYCEIVRSMSPDELVIRPNGPNQMQISIDIVGLDLNGIDQLYFSLQVVFTDIQCPVTIDLQRTNGESMYNLPEFRTLSDVPEFRFNEFSFLLSEANDTIFLPNGNYSLSFHWRGYNYFSNNISITNESLYLVVRIKSVRLDVVSVQRIPGLKIEVSRYSNGLYHQSFLIKDSPSFYLPSDSSVIVEVVGSPFGSLNSYTTHFRTVVQAGSNRNITILVDENWILVGEIAITPGRLIILGTAVLIIGIIVLLSRKKLISDSIYAPFILLIVSNILPVAEFTLQRYTSPTTLPLYSLYSESYSVSLGIATSTSRMNDTVTAIANASTYDISTISYVLLLLAFVGVMFEILKEEINIEYPEELIGFTILLTLIIQCLYFAYSLSRAFYAITVTIGIGPFVTGLTFLLWIVLNQRKMTHRNSL